MKKLTGHGVDGELALEGRDMHAPPLHTPGLRCAAGALTEGFTRREHRDSSDHPCVSYDSATQIK